MPLEREKKKITSVGLGCSNDDLGEERDEELSVTEALACFARPSFSSRSRDQLEIGVAIW